MTALRCHQRRYATSAKRMDKHFTRHPKFRQGAAAREPKAQIIVAADGTMIPVVTMDSMQIDQRKTRKTSWKEARLALAYEPGAIGPIFGATTGSPKQTGEQLTRCALRIGWDEHTHIHGVGDGAPWIADQVECIFGAQGQ